MPDDRWAGKDGRTARSSASEALDVDLVGASAPMRRLKELIARVAVRRSSVLITGESGTGKELVARAIHSLSPRAAAAFIAENCASLPDGVVESELFGHVRGAFTGAERDRQGLIALAHGGTLFLDEVGDLGARTQAKLLRVIQEGEYRPVGGREVRRSDFRVIAATHRDLKAMVERGEFREDLYYRINVVALRVPPLRERVEDIPLLIEHAFRRLREDGEPTNRQFPGHGPGGGGEFGERGGTGGKPTPNAGGSPGPVSTRSQGGTCDPSPWISREALEMLLRYSWPGNVRELQNVLEGALVLAGEGVIGVAELPDRILDNALAEPDRGYAGAAKPHERVLIEIALGRFRGDKAKAARYIGWSRPKLYRLMARHGISRDFGKGSA